MTSSSFYPSMRFALVLFLASLSTGCSIFQPRMAEEPPLCVPVRDFQLVPLTRDEQKQILDLERGEVLLETIASNDAVLKSQIRLLEQMIRSHDEPLGGCD